MSQFVPNERGMDELEAALGDAAGDIAERIAARASEFAPVRTGEYRDSIHVERDGNESRVVAGAPHSAVVEFGTGDTPAFAPLTRARDDTAREIPQIVKGRFR